ncbi:flagellar hook-length control protein [Campylobacter pinnipediorum subsp. caledonicus]|uniref:Flagellar hook-length control protein n=1 Tax=Campylobacter pinnipediorum subsp. caledonicus TaxID=1874362 RepID=A0A1S6U6J9_9BACT|nr:flagellar hook-length control protein FliK [Campylobacter pinnipediorum]AQW85708.1 flagellar hook-length control protein [Campylobacter pinnipediorum subsp. caledonicus]AQW87319.1 flagellar hook-length control protein [Campylobacter pinnipediorum subsp. caledonicus]OPA72464.1 flagellar hook-length control protein FliK [Campylobacter pinnipediorum subsp. caledonicus]
MQTFNTKNQVDIFTNTNKKSPNSTKKDKSDNNEFLNMVLSAASKKADKGEKLSEKDVKDIAKSVSMKNETDKQIKKENNIKISQDLENKLDDDTKNELYENANFMQLLQVLEILNGGEKVSKFPNFTDKIANFLNKISNVEELSNIKSVNELIELANKFDLGLDKIKITQGNVDELKNMFENLGKKDFFKPVIPINLDIKNQVEQTIQQVTKNTQNPIGLNEVLKEISKPINESLKTETLKQSTQDDKKSESMLDNDLKEEINLTPKTNEMIAKDTKNQKINLQTLLYPEKEQQSGQEDSIIQTTQKDDQNDLNAIVKDIVKTANNQINHKLAVKETFSNFSQNLADQIQNYKAPFTKFNITLNPLNLGEVEITMVNRGNNLHINFNSNTNTMNIFLQNQAEFKNSLVNMGFTELEMNFSDQQNKQEQGQKKYKQMAQGESDEATNEQVLLELVMPIYI